MAIAWQGTSSNANVIAFDISYPGSWAADDLLLLFVETANQAMPSTPTGFTELACSPQTPGSATRLYGYYRVAQSGDDTTVTIGDPGDHAVAAMVAYRGVDTTTPLDVTPVGGFENTSDTTGFTGADLTTVTDGCMIVYAFSHSLDRSSATFSSWANASLSGVAESFDVNSAVGNGGGIGSCDGTKVTAGATGTTSVTYAAASVKAFMTIALRPAGAGSSGPGDSCGVLLC